jgi:transcriptional regulator with XRE-family HTH domain
MTSIAENIKTLMESEGISASDLSKVTGIDRSVLHKILSGATKNPSIDSIKAIIQHYSFHEVLYGTKENHAPIISWSDAVQFPSILRTNHAQRYIKIGLSVTENIFCLLIE